MVRIYTPDLFDRYTPFRPDIHGFIHRREAALGEDRADVYTTIVQADAPREGPGPLRAEPVPEGLEPGQHGAPEAVERGAAAARQRSVVYVAGFMSDRARIGAKTDGRECMLVCLSTSCAATEAETLVETLVLFTIHNESSISFARSNCSSPRRRFDHAQQLGPA